MPNARRQSDCRAVGQLETPGSMEILREGAEQAGGAQTSAPDGSQVEKIARASQARCSTCRPAGEVAVDRGHRSADTCRAQCQANPGRLSRGLALDSLVRPACGRLW